MQSSFRDYQSRLFVKAWLTVSPTVRVASDFVLAIGAWSHYEATVKGCWLRLLGVVPIMSLAQINSNGMAYLLGTFVINKESVESRCEDRKRNFRQRHGLPMNVRDRSLSAYELSCWLCRIIEFRSFLSSASPSTSST